MSEIERTKVGIWPPLKPNQKAYVLEGEDVADLADLAGVEHDLEVAANASRVVYTRRGSPSTDMVRRACIDTALMRYRRCFATGRRSRLTDDDVQAFSEDERKLHDLVLFLANKSIAHSVDGSENNLPYIFVQEDEEGRFTSRIRTCSTHPSHYNLLDAEALEALCLRVRDVARVKAEVIVKKIATRVKAKGPSYITALPEVAQVLMDRDEVLRRWQVDALAAGQKRRGEVSRTAK